MQNFIHFYRPFFIAAIIAIASCKEKKQKSNLETTQSINTVVKPEYDFNNIEERSIRNKLKEISGIHYLKENLFAAIEDEDGKIFTVDFSSGDIISEQAFAGAGDFEDITMDGKYYYILKSNGEIYQVPIDGEASKSTINKLQNGSDMEFESIYLDMSGENLIILCKNCNNKNNMIKAYSFNLKTSQFNPTPAYTVDFSAMKTNNGEHTEVKPSAAAIHPVEKKLYILCSVGMTLLICDLHGKVEKSYDLDPAVFKQPEGIDFMPNGDMFISNEANGGKANILKLAYRH